MNISEVSIEALSGGQSVKVATSTTSAQLPVVALPTNHPEGVPVKCTVVVDAVSFFRKGVNPTAVLDGTDQILLANTLYRVELLEGERLAVIAATGTGNAYFTPGA